MPPRSSCARIALPVPARHPSFAAVLLTTTLALGVVGLGACGDAETSDDGGPPGQGGSGSATGGATGGSVKTGGTTGTGGGAAGGASSPRGGGGAKAGGAMAGGAGGRSSGGAGGITDCPYTGHVTYTLTKAASPTADQQAAYDKITAAMDKALAYYNCYTPFTKAEMVTYVPSVQTADGNTNGSIRFGATDSMNYITAMHEIAHTVGVGSAAFGTLVVNGIFTGTHATNQLREITGIATDEVHGDTQHFWPYGLNYTSEVKSEADLLAHCKMVIAIRKDMGM